MSPFINCRLKLYAILFAAAFFANSARAQDDPDEVEQEVAHPLISINLASVNQALNRADFVFKSIERDEISDLIGAQLARFRDLAGIDRDLPAGVMIFLSEGIIPLPNPVGYVPVSDLSDFQATLNTLGTQLNKLPEADDLYELIPPRGLKQYVSLQNGYAFIGQSIDTVDRPFANPATFGVALGKRYDFCASANLRHTPKHIRELLLTTLRNSSQAGMQQRDNEPDGAYRVRRAATESNLHSVESLLEHGEELTLGLKVDEEKNHAFLELVVKAKPDSPFAQELLDGVGQPTRFAAAMSSTVPASVSMSAMFNEPTRKLLTEVFGLGVTEISRGLTRTDQETPGDEVPRVKHVEDAADSLRATVKAGHIDAFAQFFGEPPEKFVLLGAVKLVDANKFGSGLAGILEQARGVSEDAQIELSAASHGDVVFHRISGNEEDRGSRNLFGSTPALYVGTDSQAVWFAFGGEQAMPTLRAAIDRVSAGQQVAPQRDIAPFEVVINMNHWVRLGQANRESQPENTETGNEGRPRRGRGRFGELASAAFDTPGSDVLRIDSRPIENGFRMRAQFEGGFLRLLGSIIAGQIDRNNEL